MEVAEGEFVGKLGRVWRKYSYRAENSTNGTVVEEEFFAYSETYAMLRAWQRAVRVLDARENDTIKMHWISKGGFDDAK